MNLNYLAFFLIAFLPLFIAYFWYQPNSMVVKWSGQQFKDPGELKWKQILLCFVLSLALVYGYINLIIHQMGFYELFFTDIMMGDDEAEKMVKDFLEIHGQKHRHFGHGVFHGIINAFVFALPFVGLHTIVDTKNSKYLLTHFGYWLVTSAIIGGCISAFV